MDPIDMTRGVIRTTMLESGGHAGIRVVASPGAMDHAPQYIDSVLQELRQVVARAKCPVHDCGPMLSVDFGSGGQGSLNVIAQNCCPRLDEVVARALRVYPLFRFQFPQT